jgi:hypothetical protein
MLVLRLARQQLGLLFLLRLIAELPLLKQIAVLLKVRLVPNVLDVKSIKALIVLFIRLVPTIFANKI